MSTRVFAGGGSGEKTRHKIQIKTIVIVVIVILVLLCAATAFIGNFLFDFALNPNASYTMNDLFQGGDVEGIGNGPVIKLTPARESWPTAAAAAITSAWAGWSGPMGSACRRIRRLRSSSMEPRRIPTRSFTGIPLSLLWEGSSYNS